jgi:hypothetical protein
MEQGTLWELDPRAKSGLAPIWGQLDATIRMEVRTKLSVLMAKTIRPLQDPRPSEKENAHEQ